MTDGFTGINTGLFTRDLSNLGDAYQNLLNTIGMTLSDLFHQTNNFWNSPVAQQVCNSFNAPVQDLLDSIGSYCLSFMTRIGEAGQTIAQANGAGLSLTIVNTLGLAHTLSGSVTAAIAAIRDNVDGAIGMDVEKMRRLIESFKQSALSKARRAASAVPKNIALYDAQGALLQSFSTGVDQILEKISSFFDDLINSIDIKFEDEVQKIVAAKGRAQGTLDQVM